MAEDVFTEPTETADAWADVRMTDPDASEWDVDVVVADGRVEFVDLRIRPAMLDGFLDCLLDDVSEQRAAEILDAVAEGRSASIDAEDETDD